MSTLALHIQQKHHEYKSVLDIVEGFTFLGIWRSFKETVVPMFWGNHTLDLRENSSRVI